MNTLYPKTVNYTIKPYKTFPKYYKPETYKRSQPKISRNSLCPCGSGKKYKKCCLNKG